MIRVSQTSLSTSTLPYRSTFNFSLAAAVVNSATNTNVFTTGLSCFSPGIFDGPLGDFTASKLMLRIRYHARVSTAAAGVNQISFAVSQDAGLTFCSGIFLITLPNSLVNRYMTVEHDIGWNAAASKARGCCRCTIPGGPAALETFTTQRQGDVAITAISGSPATSDVTIWHQWSVASVSNSIAVDVLSIERLV